MRLIDADSLPYDEFLNHRIVMWDDIERSKTIDAEPVRHGKWIEHHEPYTWMGYTYWSCSECGFECGYEKDITIRTNYCPQCGAKLDSNDSNALNALEIDEVVEK